MSRAMLDPDPSIAFEVISEDLGRLVVARTSNHFGARSTLQSTEIGFYDSPLYHFEHPYWSSDEEWSIAPHAVGHRVADRIASGDEWAAQYDLWRAGSRSTHASAVLEHLPRGTYLLVRSPSKPQAPSQFLLGNSMQARAENVRVLHPDGPVYSCLLGADRDALPPFNQPLVGLVVLDYTCGAGLEHLDGVLFMPFGAPGGGDPGPDRDVVLVLPTDGELVLDGADANATPMSAGRLQWKTSIAPAFAERCTDSITGLFRWKQLCQSLGIHKPRRYV